MKIRLASGGTIEITFDVNLATMGPKDRAFLAELLGSLAAYIETAKEHRDE